MKAASRSNRLISLEIADDPPYYYGSKQCDQSRNRHHYAPQTRKAVARELDKKIGKAYRDDKKEERIEVPRFGEATVKSGVGRALESAAGTVETC